MSDVKYLHCDSPEFHPQLQPEDVGDFPAERPKLICSSYDEDYNFLDGEFEVENAEIDVIEEFEVESDPESQHVFKLTLEDGVECFADENRSRFRGKDLTCRKTGKFQFRG